MKKVVLLLPIAAFALSGCGTAERMNRMVNESTCSIQRNAQAVRCSTQVIRENAAVIKSSTETLEENRRNLEQLF